MSNVTLVVPLIGLLSFAHAQTRVMRCPEAATAGVSTERIHLISSFAAKSANREPIFLQQIRYRMPPPKAAPTCWCGAVTARSLTSNSTVQEMPMMSLPGSFRFDHLLLQEATRFSSGIVAGLNVSVGVSDSGEDLIRSFALMSDAAPQNTVFETPGPPILTGTYSLLLRFTATSPLSIDGSSNFTAGTLNWEVCGFQVH